MYYKITSFGDKQYTDLGMINVDASFYLEKGDLGFEKYEKEHFVNGQYNPFCNHSIQFEADVTESEIFKAFDRALKITHQNYLIDDLHCQNGGTVVNADIHYLERKSLFQNPTAQLQNIISDAENKVNSLKNIDFNKSISVK